MSPSFPEPSGELSAPAALFARYLDFYRETVIARTLALSEDEQRHSRLPSGWTPLELLHHLAHMERRWFVWGFLGEEVGDPWGDGAPRWQVPEDIDLAVVATMLRAGGRRTSWVLATYAQDELAPEGPRFPGGGTATLGWICFHVLQEYARHAGHLDVAVELAGGPTGESR